MRRLLFLSVLPALGALSVFACSQGSGTQASSGGGKSSSTAGSGGAGAATSSSSSSVESSSAGGAASSSSVASSSSASSSSVASSSVASSSVASSSGSGGAATCTAPGEACAGTAPNGWNGPAILYDGDPTMVPTCPSEHPTVAYQGTGTLIPQPAVCGACTCATPPVSCTPQDLSFFSDAQCQTSVGTAVQPAPGQCGSVQPPGSTIAYSVAAAMGLAGACALGGGGKSLPPPAWQRAGLVCIGGELGGGCPGGMVCTGAPAAPFVQTFCVWTGGDFACPAGFGTKHLFIDSVLDTRDCSGCSCGAPQTNCTVVTHVHSDGMCQAAPVAVPDDGSCVAAAGSAGSMDVSVNAMASCAPSGGQPVGTIAEGPQRTTVCCGP